MLFITPWSVPYAFFSPPWGRHAFLDKKNGTLLQEIKLTGRARSTPVLTGNKLILTYENNSAAAYGENLP